MTTEEIQDELVKYITLLSSARSDVGNGLYAHAASSVQKVRDGLFDMAQDIRGKAGLNPPPNQ